MSLTDKQARFIEAYLLEPNATRAAKAAGYSAATADRQGSRLLSHVGVADELARRQKILQVRCGITPEMVIAELAKIGFSDIRQVVQWRANVSALVEDEETGEPALRTFNQVVIVDSAKLDAVTAGAISEVSQTKDGSLKVKLYDKPTALVRIGQHLGMFRPLPLPEAPGKKDEARRAAENAGAGTDWGDDLGAPGTPLN